MVAFTGELRGTRQSSTSDLLDLTVLERFCLRQVREGVPETRTCAVCAGFVYIFLLLSKSGRVVKSVRLRVSSREREEAGNENQKHLKMAESNWASRFLFSAALPCGEADAEVTEGSGNAALAEVPVP